MKRTILKNVGIGLCFLLSTGTVCAQNYPGKVKNAQGIEVTYQSNYKGKARPGHLLMTVSSDRVSLTNVWPEQNDRPDPRPEDKTPVTGSYIDYTTRQAYRRAELPQRTSDICGHSLRIRQRFHANGRRKTLRDELQNFANIHQFQHYRGMVYQRHPFSWYSASQCGCT